MWRKHVQVPLKGRCRSVEELMKLRLEFTRVSPTHHRIKYTREDGSGERADIESKTFIEHDFLHYSLESEAHVSTGFFGLLGQGYTFSELNIKTPSDFNKEEALHVERAVGVFTGMIKSGGGEAGAMNGVRNFYEAEGRP